MSLHIHAPKAVKETVRVLYCPKCDKKRRVNVRFYEWYGPGATCSAKRRRWKNVVKPCGYHWQWE
jgi:hypothetical protein